MVAVVVRRRIMGREKGNRIDMPRTEEKGDSTSKDARVDPIGIKIEVTIATDIGMRAAVETTGDAREAGVRKGGEMEMQDEMRGTAIGGEMIKTTGIAIGGEMTGTGIETGRGTGIGTGTGGREVSFVRGIDGRISLCRTSCGAIGAKLSSYSFRVQHSMMYPFIRSSD